MIIKMSLFDEEITKPLQVRSKEWKKKRYQELENISYKEIKKLQNKIFEKWEQEKNIDDYDRGTLEVITDICHSKYYKEASQNNKHIYYRKPYYL